MTSINVADHKVKGWASVPKLQSDLRRNATSHPLRAPRFERRLDRRQFRTLVLGKRDLPETSRARRRVRDEELVPGGSDQGVVPLVCEVELPFAESCKLVFAGASTAVSGRHGLAERAGVGLVEFNDGGLAGGRERGESGEATGCERLVEVGKKDFPGRKVGAERGVAGRKPCLLFPAGAAGSRGSPHRCLLSTKLLAWGFFPLYKPTYIQLNNR